MSQSVDYNYFPMDIDDELFLTDVPLNVIENSLSTQFDDPLEYRKNDYVQSFITKYNFSRENYREEDLMDLDSIRDEFVSFMLEKFDTYFNVGFVDFDSLDEEHEHDAIHIIYRFFIKNIKKNFVNITWNYIQKRKKEIQEIVEKKKDVTTAAFKQEINNEYDIQVLSNMSKIIDYVFAQMRLSDDVDIFFKWCQGDDYILELEYIKMMYSKMKVTGNFIDKYIDMIDDDFKSEIQSKIRNKILRNYPTRVTKKESLQTDEDDIEGNDDGDEEPSEE